MCMHNTIMGKMNGFIFFTHNRDFTSESKILFLLLLLLFHFLMDDDCVPVKSI